MSERPLLRFRLSNWLVVLLATPPTGPLAGQALERSQATASLSGRVINRETRQGIVGARIEVLATQGTSTSGADGRFVVGGLPTGVYAVRFSAIGYQPFTLANVVLGSGKPYTVLVELDHQPVRLDSIAVTAAPYFQPALQAPSLGQALNAEDIRRAPGVQEDVVRAVALLPGVGVTTGGRNDLIVRGGAPFENLFLVEGLEVPNINHFGSQGSTGGPISLINVDFVQGAEFSTGGFGVRYGDRTASVTSIDLREGNRDRLSGEVNLSATGFGAMMEGPAGARGSFLASVRRSYLDLVFALADFAFRPTYYDATIRLDQQLSDRDRLSFLAIGAIDDVSLDNSTPDNRYDNSRVLATDQWQYFAGLTWQRSLASGLLDVTLGRTYTRFESSQADSLGNPIFLNDSREAVTSLRGELSWSPSDALDLRAGQDLRTSGPLEYEILLPGELRRDAAGTPRPLRVDTSFTNLRASTWGEAAVEVMSRVRLTAGLRLDYYGDLRGATRLSPRLLLAYAPVPGTTLSLAAGRYVQSPSSIWLVGDRTNPGALEPFRADQLVAGVERLLRPDLALQVQAYHKWYGGYPARLYRPQSVLAPAGFEDVTSDIPFGLEPLRPEGKGTAYGAEAILQKRLSAVPVYGLTSISLNRTGFSGLDGVRRPGTFDTRVIGNIVLGYRVNTRWEVSGKFRVASGRPTTPYVTEGQAAGTLDFTRYNAGPRLPVFHALDLRVDRRWSFQAVQLETYVDIQNVYNHRNVSSYSWDPRTATIKPDENIGFLPTIGVNIEF